MTSVNTVMPACNIVMLDTFYSAPELEHETVEGMFGTIERFAADVMPKISVMSAEDLSPELLVLMAQHSPLEVLRCLGSIPSFSKSSGIG